MSAAVKPSTGGDVTAFLASVGLHTALLAVPLIASLYGHKPSPAHDTLPNSVAMIGNSIEVDAPTPEVAAAPAAAPPETPPPEAEAKPEPVDVKALHAEPATEPAPAALPLPATPRAPATVPPRPRPKAPPKPPKAAAEAASPAAGSETPTSGAPAAGTFGQEGLAPGVRRLGYAFTRAIPAATPADDAWRELPAGHVGTIRIELEVDESNRLGALKRWQARPGEPAPPAALERMVERTLLLLRAGQFALSGSNQPGSERLVIDVTLRDDSADPDDDSANVVSKGFDGATPSHPGRAHFRYGTGRTFEAKVTIVSSGK